MTIPPKLTSSISMSMQPPSTEINHTSNSDPLTPTAPRSSVPPSLPPQTVDTDSESDNGTGDRFVGELNPESIFLVATSPQTTLSSGDDNVGIWVPRKALEGLQKRVDRNAALPLPSIYPPLSNVILACVQQQCQQLFVPASAYAAIHRIYVQEVHSIFPVIDLPALETNLASTSAGTLLIKQAVCLAASASPRAAKHLVLPGTKGELIGTDPATFANQVASAIRLSIDLGFVKDRIAVVQALTILALFIQFSYQSDISAEVTARAISHAQTLGLHLDKPNGRKDRVYLTRLFCCIWVLDKLNAAFQGRPTLLHEHDFDRNLEKAIAEQDGCFRLLLRVCSRLDSTIALYRPEGSNNTNPTGDYPSFEELIHECDATRVSSGPLGKSKSHSRKVHVLIL